MTLLAQLLRFAGVGALATLVHVAVAISAEALGAGPQMANLSGFCAAVALSYLGQGRLTFEVELRHAFHAPRFVASALLGLAVSSSVTQVAVVWGGLHFVLGMAIVAVLVPATTFVMCKFWVFRPGYSAGP